MGPQSDPRLEHTLHFRVRSYELDENGHVNNSVYLAWIENLANEHAEAIGFGREWSRAHGGGWVIRRHDVTYHLPARRGDEIAATVRVEGLRGVRGWRRTWIRRGPDDVLLAEALSEYAWVRLADGRPAHVPAEIVAAVEQARAEETRRAPTPETLP